MNDHRKLQDRVVVVTGADGGIGRAVCQLLAREGATLLAVARRRASRELEDTIQSASGKSFIIEADLEKAESWNNVVIAAQTRFRTIDTLVNCIGITNPKTFLELSQKEIDKLVATNFGATVCGIAAILPTMLRQKSGHIITIGSLGGIVPTPGDALYSATKFAVRGLCFSLYEEMKQHGIDVSVISPGPVETKMLDLVAAGGHSKLTFVYRPLDPENVARAVLRVIEHPRREVILPRKAAWIALLVNHFPKAFDVLHPLLKVLGGVGIRRYRKNHRLTIPTQNWESSHV
jgi:short-subunit dehydrogenase